MSLPIKSITLGMAFLLIVAIATGCSQKGSGDAHTADRNHQGGIIPVPVNIMISNDLYNIPGFSHFENIVCTFEATDDASTMLQRSEHVANGLKGLGQTTATIVVLPMILVAMLMSSRSSLRTRARFLLFLALGILCLSLAPGYVLAWLVAPMRCP